MRWGMWLRAGGAALVLLMLGAACSSSDSTPAGNAAAASTAVAAAPTAEAAAPTAVAAAPTAEAEPGMEEGMSADQLLARGAELYQKPGSCITCHGADGMGVIGPPILGKTADIIRFQLEINPAMEAQSYLTDDDLQALEVYLASLMA